MITALYLLQHAYYSYSNEVRFFNRSTGKNSVAVHNTSFDPNVTANIPIPPDTRTEEERLSARESARRSMEQDIAIRARVRDAALIGFIIVAVCLVTAGIFFVAHRGHSSLITLLYWVFSLANFWLAIIYPVHMYRIGISVICKSSDNSRVFRAFDRI